MKYIIYILSLFFFSIKTQEQTQNIETTDFHTIEEKIKDCFLSNNSTSSQLRDYIKNFPDFNFESEYYPFAISDQDKYIFRNCKRQFDERTLRIAGQQKKRAKASEMKTKITECVEEFENRSEELEDYLNNYKKADLGMYYFIYPSNVESEERKVVLDCRSKIESTNKIIYKTKTKTKKHFGFRKRNKKKKNKNKNIKLVIFDDDDFDD